MTLNFDNPKATEIMYSLKSIGYIHSVNIYKIKITANANRFENLS